MRIILVFLMVCFSGCNEISNSVSDKKRTIDIVGTYIEQTVNEPEKMVILDIVGSYITITITKNTNLIQIDVTGSYNTVIVSTSLSFDMDLVGTDNNVEYYD